LLVVPRFGGVDFKWPISAAMASVHQKGKAWHCQFVYHGARHTFSLGKVSQEEVETRANQVDYLLMRLKQNLLHVPPSMNIVTFIEFDGKPPETLSDDEILTLACLRDRYAALEAVPCDLAIWWAGYAARRSRSQGTSPVAFGGIWCIKPGIGNAALRPRRPAFLPLFRGSGSTNSTGITTWSGSGC
jgi:hypothetical protein